MYIALVEKQWLCLVNNSSIVSITVHLHSSRIFVFTFLAPCTVSYITVHCISILCTNTGSIMNYSADTICERLSVYYRLSVVKTS